VGRFVLSGAVVAGWIVGFLWSVSEVALDVLTEELPDERQSRFSAFALGAGIYAVILLIR
jgi:hypothetical protein